MPEITCSKVFYDFAEMAKHNHIIVMEGSSRSTKTYSILQWIIMTALQSKQKLRIAIIRSKLTWIKATLFKDFQDILRDQFNMWDEQSMNRTDWEYKLGNSEISFLGLDTDAGRQKAHGMKSDIVYFNECLELDWEPVQQIMMRNRRCLVFDFNPNMGDTHWMVQKIMKRPETVRLHSTFKDNPWISQYEKAEILGYEPTEENKARGTADETLWKIYGLGERAVIKGRVFPVYTVVPEFPKDCKNVCFGMDFGFTSDPTTVVKKGEIDGAIYYDLYLYKRGLVNLKSHYAPEQGSIEEELEKAKVSKKIPIFADSAEPKSIKDLRNAGWDVRPVQKGLDSVLDGINAMKRYRIHITERSLELIKEFDTYKWKENKDGTATNTPIDSYNHALDGCRYATIMSEPGNNFNDPRPEYEAVSIGTSADRYDPWYNPDTAETF